MTDHNGSAVPECAGSLLIAHGRVQCSLQTLFSVIETDRYKTIAYRERISRSNVTEIVASAASVATPDAIYCMTAMFMYV